MAAVAGAWLARGSACAPFLPSSEEAAVAWCAEPSLPAPASAVGLSLSAAVSSIAHCSDFIDHRCPSAKTHRATDASGPPAVNHWQTETTDYSSRGHLESLARQGKAALQIMRLDEDYTPVAVAEGDGAAMEHPDVVAGNPAPVMRLVGFFPGATTTQVYHALMDVQERLLWDGNYLAFEQWPKPSWWGTKGGGGDEEAKCYSLDDESIRRDMAAVAPKVPLCVGDTCRLVPSVESELLDHNWLCHKVGSRFLARFGIAPRFFRYERVGYAHRMRDVALPASATRRDADGDASPASPADPSPHEERPRSAALADAVAYDILYCGSRQGVAEATAASHALSDFLLRVARTTHTREGGASTPEGSAAGDKPTAAPVVPVDLNYQHVLLVPVASFQKQLLHHHHAADGRSPPHHTGAVVSPVFDRLANSGSMRDTAATRAAYELLRASTVATLHGDESRKDNNNNSSSSSSSGSTHAVADSGTLMVMTSANDVSLPTGLPTWLQRYLSSVLSHQAYDELSKALKNMKSVPTAAL